MIVCRTAHCETDIVANPFIWHIVQCFETVHTQKRASHLAFTQARALLARYTLVQSEFVDLALLGKHVRAIQVETFGRILP